MVIAPDVSPSLDIPRIDELACYQTLRAIAATPIRQPKADGETLLEIAEIIDQVCARRAELNPDADIDESELRCVLFDLLDAPTQLHWLRYRCFEIYQQFFPGLADPAPMGITIGELVYAYGLPDYACPSRDNLIQALTWSTTQTFTI